MLPSPVRVIIYDSSTLQCELLATGLRSTRPEFDTRCADDLDALDSLLAADPNCIVILSDGSSSGGNIAQTRRLRPLFPELRFILLLPEGRLDRVIQAFKAGARGIVYSNENLEQLARCIESVSRGEVWVRATDLPRIFDGMLKSNGPAADLPSRYLLSRREEEISRLVADGLSNREVSQTLKISESTVKNSMFRIFEKLGISNRVELSRYVNGVAEAERPAEPRHGPTSFEHKTPPSGTKTRLG